MESPLEANPLNSQFRINPVSRLFYEEFNSPHDIYTSNDSSYPVIATTYRVTEHWQTGVMTRHTPWLLEMMPQIFVEMSRELAVKKGIKNGMRVKISSARGSIWAIAAVTSRFKPFTIMGNIVHQVGLPWCYGWQYPEDGSGGDSANILTASIGDANTMIPETKAFMVNIENI